MKTVREIIGDREAYAVSPEMTVHEVVGYLCERKIGAVAVCTSGRKVVGVFSERDLLRRVVSEERDPRSTLVSEVMSEEVVSVEADEPHHVARNLMLGKNFRHLAVVNSSGMYQGFVSMRELMDVDLEESRGLVQKLNDDYYEEQFKPDAQS